MATRSSAILKASLLTLSLTLALSPLGCDHRAVGGNVDSGGGSGTPDSGVRDSSAPDNAGPITPPTIPPTVPPSSSSCVVAIRVDNCCTAAQPASLDAVQKDECLLLFANRWPVPSTCRARWPKACDNIDCAAVEPPSRVATRVNGKCQFTDECRGVSHCTVARNVGVCCSCPRAYSASQLLTNPCLFPSGKTGPLPAQCQVRCDTVRCADCKPITSVGCTVGDALNRCVSK